MHAWTAQAITSSPSHTTKVLNYNNNAHAHYNYNNYTCRGAGGLQSFGGILFSRSFSLCCVYLHAPCPSSLSNLCLVLPIFIPCLRSAMADNGIAMPRRIKCTHEGCSKSYSHHSSLSRHLRLDHRSTDDIENVSDKGIVCNQPQCSIRYTNHRLISP